MATLTERRRLVTDAGPMSVGGGLQASAVKIMLDGVCENLTGAMLSPYRDHGDECGMTMFDEFDLRRIVTATDAQGFDVHIHAVGDRAVHMATRVLTGLGRRADDRRHQIAHLDVIDHGDLPRMALNDITANVSPLWARNDSVLVETKLPLLTDDQRRWHFAFGTMASHGVRLAFGSDWPVSSPDPLWAIHTAVNRTAPSRDPHGQDDVAQHEPLLPDEALSPERALRAATINAAYANRTDAVTGSIAVGKSADLVILDGDPLTVEPAELGNIVVDTTFAGGVPVYQR